MTTGSTLLEDALGPWAGLPSAAAASALDLAEHKLAAAEAASDAPETGHAMRAQAVRKEVARLKSRPRDVPGLSARAEALALDLIGSTVAARVTGLASVVVAVLSAAGESLSAAVSARADGRFEQAARAALGAGRLLDSRPLAHLAADVGCVRQLRAQLRDERAALERQLWKVCRDTLSVAAGGCVSVSRASSAEIWNGLALLLSADRLRDGLAPVARELAAQTFQPLVKARADRLYTEVQVVDSGFSLTLRARGNGRAAGEEPHLAQKLLSSVADAVQFLHARGFGGNAQVTAAAGATIWCDLAPELTERLRWEPSLHSHALKLEAKLLATGFCSGEPVVLSDHTARLQQREAEGRRNARLQRARALLQARTGGADPSDVAAADVSVGRLRPRNTASSSQRSVFGFPRHVETTAIADEFVDLVLESCAEVRESGNVQSQTAADTVRALAVAWLAFYQAQSPSETALYRNDCHLLAHALALHGMALDIVPLLRI